MTHSCNFFQLPDELLRYILSEWLTFGILPALDCALTNKTMRAQYLQLLASLRYSIPTLNISRRHAKLHSFSWTDNLRKSPHEICSLDSNGRAVKKLLGWLRTRHIVVEKIEVHSTFLVGPWLAQRLRAVASAAKSYHLYLDIDPSFDNKATFRNGLRQLLWRRAEEAQNGVNIFIEGTDKCDGFDDEVANILGYGLKYAPLRELHLKNVVVHSSLLFANQLNRSLTSLVIDNVSVDAFETLFIANHFPLLTSCKLEANYKHTSKVFLDCQRVVRQALAVEQSHAMPLLSTTTTRSWLAFLLLVLSPNMRNITILDGMWINAGTRRTNFQFEDGFYLANINLSWKHLAEAAFALRLDDARDAGIEHSGIFDHKSGVKIANYEGTLRRSFQLHAAESFLFQNWSQLRRLELHIDGITLEHLGVVRCLAGLPKALQALQKLSLNVFYKTPTQHVQIATDEMVIYHADVQEALIGFSHDLGYYQDTTLEELYLSNVPVWISKMVAGAQKRYPHSSQHVGRNDHPIFPRLTNLNLIDSISFRADLQLERWPGKCNLLDLRYFRQLKSLFLRSERVHNYWFLSNETVLSLLPVLPPLQFLRVFYPGMTSDVQKELSRYR